MAASTPRSSSRREVTRDIAFSLLLGGLAPLILYRLVRPHTDDLHALIIAAAAPALDNLISLVRHRRLDVFGVLILGGLLLSILLVLAGGSPRLILVRESFLTGATGLVFLLSLLYRRPLIYYFALHFDTGNDPQRVAEFAGYWQYAYFRFVMRLMTIVWGATLLLEAAVKTYLAFTLSISRFLAISPVITYSIIGLTIAWTIWYARRSRRRGAEIRASRAAGGAVATE